MTLLELQPILTIITILGSGVSAYVGVRVALAVVTRDVSNLKEDVKEIRADHGSRLNRLEARYFKRD